MSFIGQINRSLILDIFFPPRCTWCNKVVPIHTTVCPDCAQKLDIIRLPYTNFKPEDSYYLACVWAVYFYVYPVRDAILRFKFEDEKELYKPFAKDMAITAQINKLNSLYDVIVPVPLSPKRMKERHYNQSALLAQEMAKELNMAYLDNILMKTVETGRQMESNAIERRSNVKNAFSVQNSEWIINKRILIIDDIVTSGSTLEESAKALINAGAAACGALCLSSAWHQDILKNIQNINRY